MSPEIRTEVSPVSPDQLEVWWEETTRAAGLDAYARGRRDRGAAPFEVSRDVVVPPAQGKLGAVVLSNV